MKEYLGHLEEYLNYWYADFSKAIPSSQWGDRRLAEEYLRKYWLPEHEYLSVWKPIQDKIFVQGKRLPDLVYRPEFDIFALRGGCLFLEEDFLQLQKAIQKIGDDFFVVIQQSQEFTEGEPMFRMKFPAHITWKEMTSGNYISAVLFEMGYNEYFVFGESGNYGKYAANDHEYPLDIIGFKPELTSVFTDQFKKLKEDRKKIWEWLPQKYKKLIKKQESRP